MPSRALIMVAAGIGIPLLAALNARLGATIGSPAAAATVLFILAFAVAVAGVITWGVITWGVGITQVGATRQITSRNGGNRSCAFQRCGMEVRYQEVRARRVPANDRGTRQAKPVSRPFPQAPATPSRPVPASPDARPGHRRPSAP